MAEISTPPPPTLTLPADAQHGIGAAVQHTLMFAPALTDILIHEGRVMRAKSARGTLALHQLFSAIPPFIVTREHIVHYLAGTASEMLDGIPHGVLPGMGMGMDMGIRGPRTCPVSAQHHWDTCIQPLLTLQRPINVRVDGFGGYSLRYSLFMHDAGQLALVMRITPPGIAPLASLSLPRNLVATLTEATSGFVIITGPTGSGKSETAMSLLDWHNARHSGHILTIEDPVEKRLEPRKAIVTQREVGRDVPSVADGMRDALRLCPDVLFTSEIRDADTAAQAIQAGESGTLTIATTHGRSVTGALRKILSHTGANAKAMRSVLAGNLIAVVRQALVPARDGKNYLMAADVLFNSGPVTRAIERGDWIGLESAFRGGGRLDAGEWVSMNDRLVDLVRRGEIDATEALRQTSDIPALKKGLAGMVPEARGR